MTNIELTKRKREIIYANVAMLTKAFLELHSYASCQIEDIKKSKDGAISLCTQILGTVATHLDLHIKDFVKIHKDIDTAGRDDDNELSDLSVDDFIN